MKQRKKKIIRKKVSKKKRPVLGSIIRLCAVIFLFFALVFSVCTLGYVIFFRTVFAQEILPSIKSAVVFEEPDPPEPVEQVVLKKSVKKPNLPAVAISLPKVAIIIDDMGYHELLGKELLDMPIELTYSFLPSDFQ